MKNSKTLSELLQMSDQEYRLWSKTAMGWRPPHLPFRLSKKPNHLRMPIRQLMEGEYRIGLVIEKFPVIKSLKTRSLHT